MGSANVTAGIEAASVTDGATDEAATDVSAPAWLETPVLRFSNVRCGRSEVAAIVVRSLGHEPIELEIVAPPLAPFSVVQPPRPRWTTDDDEGQTARVWIRYDATAPMAVDSGQIVIDQPSTGQRWTVVLDGQGELSPAGGSLN